jgi:hypothetical protein
VISWDTGGFTIGTYEVSIGTSPGATDVSCWEPASEPDTYQYDAYTEIFQNGQTYYANVRYINEDAEVSSITSSTGWTVDTEPPTAPSQANDFFIPEQGLATWLDDSEDTESGVAGYEVAIGASPWDADLLDWTESESSTEHLIGDLGTESGWAYLSVRAFDHAGNRSARVTAPGYIECPEGYVFVPGDDDPTINTIGFCTAKYEMRITGVHDSSLQSYTSGVIPESRADGLPWTRVGVPFGLNMSYSPSSDAVYACDYACREQGPDYFLQSNDQWQTLARNIEGVAANWSGGAVGSGSINQGHSDMDPEIPLAASTDDDPCAGTGQPDCTDPTSDDFSQKRTHTMSTGAIIWDLSGNVSEWLTDPPSIPYKGGPFTCADPELEDPVLYAQLCPQGPYGLEEGTGDIMFGSFPMSRGGSYYVHETPATPELSKPDSSKNTPGLFSAQTYSSLSDETNGFRCIYQPVQP